MLSHHFKGIFVFTLSAISLTALAMSNAHADASAYEKSVYQFTRQLTTCMGCHKDGQNGAPRFAQDDLASAYGIGLRFVNRYNPKLSQFVERSKNGHCGDDVCRTDGTAMLAAISTWLASDNEGFPPQAVRVNSLPEKVVFKAGVKEFQKVRFRFANGVAAEVELRLFSDIYLEARYPRIAAPTTTTFIKDIQFFVNNQYQTGANAALRLAEGTVEGVPALATLVPTDPFPVRVLAFRSSLMNEAEFAPDVVMDIELSLGVLDVSAPNLECVNYESFVAQVNPLLYGRRCFDCHGQAATTPQAAVAKASFLMTDNDWTTCRNTLFHVNPNDVKESTFVKVFFGIPNSPNRPIHQQQGIASDRPVERLKNWMDGTL